jgi:hypothetical protein
MGAERIPNQQVLYDCIPPSADIQFVTPPEREGIVETLDEGDHRASRDRTDLYVEGGDDRA